MSHPLLKLALAILIGSATLLFCAAQHGNQAAMATPAPVAAATTWTLASHSTSGNLTCSPTCTAYSLGFTGQIGDVLLVFAYTGANKHLSSGNTGYGTWVFPANCNIYQSSSTGTVSCGYVILTATVTSITMTMNVNQSNPIIIDVRAYHSTAGGIVAESVPTPTTSSSCSNNCVAPTVSLTGTADVVVSSIATGNTGCSAASPFANFSAPSGDGVADHLNTSSGTGATFTQGTSCPTAAASAAGMVSIAFK